MTPNFRSGGMNTSPKDSATEEDFPQYYRSESGVHWYKYLSPKHRINLIPADRNIPPEIEEWTRDTGTVAIWDEREELIPVSPEDYKEKLVGVLEYFQEEHVDNE